MTRAAASSRVKAAENTENAEDSFDRRPLIAASPELDVQVARLAGPRGWGLAGRGREWLRAGERLVSGDFGEQRVLVAADLGLRGALVDPRQGMPSRARWPSGCPIRPERRVMRRLREPLLTA